MHFDESASYDFRNVEVKGELTHNEQLHILPQYFISIQYLHDYLKKVLHFIAQIFSESPAADLLSAR